MTIKMCKFCVYYESCLIVTFTKLTCVCDDCIQPAKTMFMARCIESCACNLVRKRALQQRSSTNQDGKTVFCWWQSDSIDYDGCCQRV